MASSFYGFLFALFPGIEYGEEMNIKITKAPRKEKPAELRHMDSLARLMDAQFRIPGTNFRFGLDAIIGLIPGIGDLSTFAISGYIIMIMAKNGASGFVLGRMVLNVVIDALVGMIPVIGDIADFGLKANMRNMRLMNQYYEQGRHLGGAWKIIVPVLLILFLVLMVIIWLGYRLISSLF